MADLEIVIRGDGDLDGVRRVLGAVLWGLENDGLLTVRDAEVFHGSEFSRQIERLEIVPFELSEAELEELEEDPAGMVVVDPDEVEGGT